MLFITRSVYREGFDGSRHCLLPPHPEHPARLGCKTSYPFTNFFLDYVPVYAKVPYSGIYPGHHRIAIPLLAMMALKKIVDEPEILTEKIKYVYASFGLTAGFCLLFAHHRRAYSSQISYQIQETQALQQLPREYISQS